ncbi:MAG: hypothetical protein HY710_00250 [Candidatus Latescibacteria bacterium]|nr:hypothetical protein [Candidatus Latescibacterota bacterium]
MSNEYDIAYFAYDVLVNPQLRPPDTQAVPGRLKGWVREWRHCIDTPKGKTCTLTVVRHPFTWIDGVYVLDRAARIIEVDHKEPGYQRIRIDFPRQVLGKTHPAVETYIYTSTGNAYRPDYPGLKSCPIWRSYLDGVLAGYLDLGGREAADNFITSTEGWNVPILDDRDSPRYALAVAIPETTQHEIDQVIEQHGLVNLQFKE